MDQERHLVRPRRRPRRIGLRDRADRRNAGAAADVPQDRRRHMPADVVGVGVDAAGAGVPEAPVEMLRLVIEAVVQAQLLDDVAALGVAPGDAHGATALALGDLADDRPDGPEAAETTTVSPRGGRPTWRRTTYAVIPGMPDSDEPRRPVRSPEDLQDRGPVGTTSPDGGEMSPADRSGRLADEGDHGESPTAMISGSVGASFDGLPTGWASPRAPGRQARRGSALQVQAQQVVVQRPLLPGLGVLQALQLLAEPLQLRLPPRRGGRVTSPSQARPGSPTPPRGRGLLRCRHPRRGSRPS